MQAEDKLLIERLRVVLNRELIKRSLIRYFAEKAFENFDRSVYAPMLQDLPVRVPELADKLEIVPYVRETSPTTGQVTMGWNLFVLGTNRMSLGESSHMNMNEFQNAINGPMVSSTSSGQKTPAEIIDFVISTLGTSKHGMIRPVSTVSMPSARSIVNRPSIGPGATSTYYEKRKSY